MIFIYSLFLFLRKDENTATTEEVDVELLHQEEVASINDVIDISSGDGNDGNSEDSVGQYTAVDFIHQLHHKCYKDGTIKQLK